MEKRAVSAVAVYNLFRGLAVGGYMTVFPMYMNSLGYSMEEIGFVIAASSLILAFILPAAGAIIDLYGPRLTVAVTGLAQVAGILIAAYSSSLSGLTVSYFLFLLAFMVGQPARMSFLARSVEENRLGRVIGLTSSVFSASRLSGPIAAGFIAGAVGFREAFQILALSSLIGLISFIAISVGVRLKPLAGATSIVESYRSLLRAGGIRSILLYVSIDRFGWSLWFPLLSAHLYAAGYSEALVGSVITLSGVIQTLLMPLAGALVDRYGAPVALTLSEILGVATAIGFSEPTPLARAYFSAVLMGISIALWVPGYNTLIARAGNGSGEAYAAANTARSLAGAPTPYIGGLAYEALSPSAPYILSSAVLLVAAVMAYKIGVEYRGYKGIVVKEVIVEAGKS